MFRIVKGKLKKATHEWQEYLLNKELLLCTGLENTLNLLAIDEKDLNEYCNYLWDKNYFVREEYERLEWLIEDIELGNYGFGFDVDEIEIIEIIKEIKLGG
ncbi:hypothetical protein CIW83_18295 [Tissierella sp. P1]|uniref:hypothetical protein n=1 Tax=Tissierella sp. P1 TaxID=1280483 RepID=UPI000BA16F40|nr:hypothetical protein [Tissierella sp. P1]OZV10770.1 hypothetical protein CIW83_18295 [Tissierella sp. P1]